MAYCNTNWGGQFFSAVKDGTSLELFKFCSLTGFFIYRSGGPIVCKYIRQNQTALIYCEAEIMTTNDCATEIQWFKHRANNIGIPEAYSRIKIYYYNKAAVERAASVTSKCIKHVNLQENMIWECHHLKDVDVVHIPGIINPSNIFWWEWNKTHTSEISETQWWSLFRRS